MNFERVIAPGGIVITGAARGIGRATADRFLSQGWRVGLYDVDADAVRETAGELATKHGVAPERVRHGVLDVREPEQWQAALDTFAEEGPIDVLMNNAGVLASGAFASMTDATLRRVVDVNLLGVINGATAGRAHLLRSQGLLLNMCSASALYGQPSLAVYAASKSAVRSLTESLELEWRRDRIRVRSILPMFVATDMVFVDGRDITNTGVFGVRLSADDVAAAAWRVVHERSIPLRSPHRAVGVQSRVLTGLSAVSPGWASRLTVRLTDRRSSHR